MTDATESTSISVLIRTFNSARALPRLFSGIKLASGDEYIIVDSGSADATLSMAASHGAQIIQAPPPFNYSKSLNLGFHAARNPWVLVISSHSVSMVPDLLGEFRSAIHQISGDVVVAYGPNSLNGRGHFEDDKIRIFTLETYAPVENLCTNGNTLYRRSAWRKIPFDETVRTGEDKIWVKAALKEGHSFCVASGARTMNRNQYSLRYMFSKGYSDSRAFAKRPISLKDLGIGIGSLIKRFLFKGMPFGNLIRYSSHHIGAFFGSRQSRDNTPQS